MQNQDSINTNEISLFNLDMSVSEMQFSEIEEKNLIFRIQLMLKLLSHMKKENLLEYQLSKKLNVSSITLTNLLQRKVGFFSIDELLNLLANYEPDIYEKISRGL